MITCPLCTHLAFPPPIASPHFTIPTSCSMRISIHFLGGICDFSSKCGVSNQLLNTGHWVLQPKLQLLWGGGCFLVIILKFTVDLYQLTLPLRSSWKLINPLEECMFTVVARLSLWLSLQMIQVSTHASHAWHACDMLTIDSFKNSSVACWFTFLISHLTNAHSSQSLNGVYTPPLLAF